MPPKIFESIFFHQRQRSGPHAHLLASSVAAKGGWWSAIRPSHARLPVRPSIERLPCSVVEPYKYRKDKKSATLYIAGSGPEAFVLEAGDRVHTTLLRGFIFILFFGYLLRE